MRRLLALLIVVSTGCASATRLHTSPEGAVLFIDGLRMGETPFVFHNEPGLPRRYHVQLYKPGFEPLDFYLDTRVSWIWGFAGVVTLVPFLWAWSLKEDYVFHLTPLGDDAPLPPAQADEDEGRDDDSERLAEDLPL